jgi:sugar phosphate isomerase/epimerase
MAGIGFHTDAFNSSNWSFEQAMQWAQRNGLKFIECGLIDGCAYIQALGYYPHIASYEDPVLLRKKLDSYGLRFSQIDAAFPMSLFEGATIGVEYVKHAIRYAKLVGAPCIDTTDNRTKPEGMTEREAMALMKRCYTDIVRVAEAYDIIINIEPHGYFTTKPKFMAEMLGFCDSPCLRMNMDTGNTFIAGQDPVAFVEEFKCRISHCHVKDVSPALAEAVRGKATGIAMSQCAIGAGVNADNIRRCVEILLRNGYKGVFSLECEGSGGLIEESLAWFRSALKDAEKAARKK